MENLTEIEMAEIAALVGDPQEPPDADALVNAPTLAKWLGLTPNHVSALAREGVLPRTPAKLFPLRRAIREYCDHARAGSVGRRADAELAAEKLRLARENADKVSIQNAKTRGELIPAADVARAWGEVATDLRAAILAIPSRVAGQVGLDRAAAATIDAEIRSTLEAIADDR